VLFEFAARLPFETAPFVAPEVCFVVATELSERESSAARARFGAMCTIVGGLNLDGQEGRLRGAHD
jgi:hypothetical protein